MTAFFCIFVAWALCYLPLFVSVRARAKLPGGYDNHDPRAQALRLEGYGRRAVAAHQNGLENFAPFAASVFVAHLGRGAPPVVTAAAVAYAALRAVYVPLYLFDLAALRSVVWTLGMAATALLFLSPFIAPAP